MAMASVPILPEDLIMEILSWLPVKSLLRFRCVSKSWSSLIFHPYFVKLHLQRSPKNTQVLLKLRDLKDLACTWASFCSIPSLVQNPSSSFHDSRHYLFDSHNFFLGSSNGLLCLHDSIFLDGCQQNWVRFWNPATNIISEPSPRLYVHSSIYRTEPYYTKFGFGYDDRSDTCMVVAMMLDTELQRMDAKVYCTGDTCWRNVLTRPSFFTFEHVGYSVSGTVNWIGFSSEGDILKPEFAEDDVAEILSYDLKNETCRCFPVPDCVFELPFCEPYLGVLNGCLSVSLDQSGTNFVVLLLKDVRDETSWTRLLNVCYESIPIENCLNADVVVLCMSGDVLLLANFEDWEFILYNVKDKKVERIERFINHDFRIMSFDYVPSLVLPG